MKSSVLFSLVVVTIQLVSMGPLSAGDVAVEQAADGSVRVKAKTYQAAFDASGTWTSLVIQGREMLGMGMKFPGKQPPSSVNVRAQLLALRNDKVIVEFAFEPSGFELSVKGAAGSIDLADAVSALVSGKQGVKSPSAKNLPDIQKVIAGDAAFELSPGVPFRAGGLVVGPPAKDPSKVVLIRFECGVSAATVALIELSDFQAMVPPTKTVAQIAEGQPVKLQATLRNHATEAVQPVLAYTVSNAFSGGKVSDPVVLPSSELAPGATQLFEIPVAVTGPGIHWVNLELRHGNSVLQRERTAFVYAADKFQPALTRPADFSDFWKSRLEKMREVPIAAEVKEIAERGTEAAAHYEVTAAGPDGTRVTVELQAPRKQGKYLAVFGGKMPDKATNPGMIQLVFPHKLWPEEATYNRWLAADNNNHIDCYLLAVRLTDYLRSRDDVSGIFLFGASRQGPIQLVNAALDPTMVVAVDAHVPTSMGLSWTELPYKGWGKTPNPPSMAAYVDPVNFAPDIRVPVMLDEGVYDGLSPAPGALAFYNHATNAPWKRLSIEPGGHGFFTSGFRQAARVELEKRLGHSLEGRVDEGVMREH